MRSEAPMAGNTPIVRQPSDDFVRFARGELTDAEYLERRVDLAMAHIKGRISDERFEMIREVLMELFYSDPVLVALRERLLGESGR